jgi:hypothetical protein
VKNLRRTIGKNPCGNDREEPFVKNPREEPP